MKQRHTCSMMRTIAAPPPPTAAGRMRLPRMIWLVLVTLILLILPSNSCRVAASSSLSPSAKRPHTRLTGYGSRSRLKSIFKGEILPKSTTNEPASLWVQRTPQGLWFQSRSNSFGNSTIRVGMDMDGHWRAMECDPNTTTTLPPTEWIPIEGIHGIYNVPSGVIWVLLTRSDQVYSAPPGDWWKIRRVHSFELVHLPTTSSSSLSLSSILSHRQIKEEARQLQLLRQALRHHDFYFCQGNTVRDMTHTLQRCIERIPTTNTSTPSTTLTPVPTDATPPDYCWWNTDSPLFQPDSRFFWNEPLVESLLEHYRDETDSSSSSAYETLLRHVIPVTSAFVGIQSKLLISDTVQYDEILLSRRSRFRAGTRFTKRGADATGAVANYAETEQVCILYNDDPTQQQQQQPQSSTVQVLSHVQTRGSIPLRWSSPADVKTYRPRVRIGTDPLAQARAVRSHLMHEWMNYGSSQRPLPSKPQLVFVNLIDKKQDQGRLGRAFDAVLQAVLEVYTHADNNETDTTKRQQEWTLPPHSVQHIWFDFHAEVKNGKWEKLGTLLKDVAPTLEEHGYFCAIRKNTNQTDMWTMIRRQRGVIRTNCMDCLDRTNVVQSIFGRYMLYRELFDRANYNSPKRSLPLEYAVAFRRNAMTLPWTTGEVAHRLLWADNADAISRLYAGTPALKGDFTRTGKRTKRGALDDGMNSLQRYYLNNFLDADRQEGMDLMVGHAEFSTDDTDNTSRQEAARSMLLGNEPNHALMKQRGLRLRQQGHRTRGIAMDLRWLPGDLQSHMKSHASGATQETKDALASMDHRAASDLPWWVIAEEDNSSDDTQDSMIPSSVSAGHVVSALVAAIQAPMATAAAVVCMLGLANGSNEGSE